MLNLPNLLSFLSSCQKDNGSYSSIPNTETNLYATDYGLLTKYYLTGKKEISESQADFIPKFQNPQTGYFIGPEIQTWRPEPNAEHSFEHICMHLTSATLPVLDLFDLEPKYPISFAHPYTDPDTLLNWLSQRDWSNAWKEGNNLLFILQFLVYLRDKEDHPKAQSALDLMLDWLDSEIDPKTGLWGTNGFCSPFVAMCGGYHQLLAYYYTQRNVAFSTALSDTTLSLQHFDGGFSPAGGGGACEDVDAVDILVNLYKLYDYRRPETRLALRRCLKHLYQLQNSDGGFPYKKNSTFIHLGVPATKSGTGLSNMFSTWFRVHTIALIAEILTDEATLKDMDFHFNPTLSMGWHSPWDKKANAVTNRDKVLEMSFYPLLPMRHMRKKAWQLKYRIESRIKKILV